MKKTTATVNRYMVHVEFTTYRGNSLTGRSAGVCLETAGSIDDLWSDIETVKKLCVGYILSKKPTYKIFMIDIKTIEHEHIKNAP
jgi:hypothetical protein